MWRHLCHWRLPQVTDSSRGGFRGAEGGSPGSGFTAHIIHLLPAPTHMPQDPQNRSLCHNSPLVMNKVLIIYGGFGDLVPVPIEPREYCFGLRYLSCRIDAYSALLVLCKSYGKGVLILMALLFGVTFYRLGRLFNPCVKQCRPGTKI